METSDPCSCTSNVVYKILGFVFFSNSYIIHSDNHIMVVFLFLHIENLLGGSPSPPVPVCVYNTHADSHC